MARRCLTFIPGLLIAFAVVSAGCSIPGRTETSDELQDQVVKAIGYQEAKRGGDFHPRIIHTQRVSRTDRELREIWTVDRRGAVLEYLVTIEFPEEQGERPLIVVHPR